MVSDGGFRAIHSIVGDRGGLREALDVRKFCRVGYGLSAEITRGGKGAAPFPVFLMSIGKRQRIAVRVSPGGKVVPGIIGVGIKEMAVVDG